MRRFQTGLSLVELMIGLALGLFISAELIFAGWTSIIVALAARRAAHNQPPHPDHEAGTPAGLAG